MLDRRRAPAFNRNFTFNLIEPAIVRLPDNTPVYFIQGGEQNILKIEMVLPAGRWNETIPGSSYFSANLLSKGTTSKSSFEIASLFDQLGAHYQAHSGADYVTLSLYSLTRNLIPALELFIDLTEDPVFKKEEFEQSRSVYLQNLKVNKEKTSFLASQLFRKLLFGDTHPYGRALDTIEAEAITRGDLVSFHQQFFYPFFIFVVGKIEEGAREKIIESLYRLKIRRVIDSDHEQQLASVGRHHTEKEGSLQTSLRVGKKAIPRRHSDYAGFVFLNHILGGYFGSRLMKNIREDKGLTYGIHSSMQIMKRDSYIIIGTDVNKENKELAFTEIRKELERLCVEEIPAEELDTARYHFIGTLQTELSTPFAHGEKIRIIVLNELDADHYSRLIQKISGLTAQQLREIANQYFQQDMFIEVSAG
jgi:zinc protease